MTEPERRQVQHITDYQRCDGSWTLCGIPLPPYVVGLAVHCEACVDVLKRDRATRAR